MCGIEIFVVEGGDNYDWEDYDEIDWDAEDFVREGENEFRFPDQFDLLSRRGPDWRSKVLVRGPLSAATTAIAAGKDEQNSLPVDGFQNNRVMVLVQATVLHLRGNIRQPFPITWNKHTTTASTMTANDQSKDNMRIIDHSVATNDKAWLCWNGEVYQVIDYDHHRKLETDLLEDDTLLRVRDLPAEEPDTETVAKLLKDAIQRAQTSLSSSAANYDFLEAITTAMSCLVNAEFAFCLVTEKSIYYGRDQLGRRSLLECHTSTIQGTTNHHQTSQIRFGISSVAVFTSQLNWKEVLPGRVFEYDLASCTIRSLALSALALSSVVPSPFDQATDQHLSIETNVSSTLWLASLQLEQLLQKSIQLRLPTGVGRTSVSSGNDHSISAIEAPLPIRSDSSAAPEEARVAVLFSGGLDSAVLAALALDLMSPSEPLELWNVSFGPNADSAADRQAALASVQELVQHYPDHDLRFICIDVDWQEVLEYETHILQLLHPKPATTMDFNISTALWFASRGVGNWIQPNLHNADTSNNSRTLYESTARILLLGMGADEQMAGYGRHRKAYTSGGWAKLRTELDLDLHRLWERNLGRDDRVISDHGREARFPYLDANVMSFLQSRPLADICNLNLAPGVGDKQILRQIALRKGLVTAGGLVKRAIQFGSRIAHVSDKQRFGSRRKAKGDKNIF